MLQRWKEIEFKGHVGFPWLFNMSSSLQTMYSYLYCLFQTHCKDLLAKKNYLSCSISSILFTRNISKIRTYPKLDVPLTFSILLLHLKYTTISHTHAPYTSNHPSRVLQNVSGVRGHHPTLKLSRPRSTVDSNVGEDMWYDFL